MIALLAIAGASVDVIVLFRFDVLPAAQTGNTILLATSLAKGGWIAASGKMVSFAGAILGAVVGALIIGRHQEKATSEKKAEHSDVVRALLAEVILLATLLIVWWFVGDSREAAKSFAPIALAALAMGIQGSSVIHLKYPGTTYITGTLMTFVTGTLGWLLRLEKGPWRHGATWLVFVGGAVIAAVLYEWAGAITLMLPMAAVVTALVLISTEAPESVKRPDRDVAAVERAGGAADTRGS